VDSRIGPADPGLFVFGLVVLVYTGVLWAQFVFTPADVYPLSNNRIVFVARLFMSSPHRFSRTELIDALRRRHTEN